MHPVTGLVLVLPTHGLPGLRARLPPGVATPGGCALEVLRGIPGAPGRVHVIVSWQRAVPLKVERLAHAVIAAGGVLRRDLDAEELRRQARGAGAEVLLVRRAADLDPIVAAVLAGPALRSVGSVA